LRTYYIVFLGCVLLGCVFGCTDKEQPITKQDKIIAGELAPDFELQGLDSKIYHLSDFRGKVVLLNFWATWCVPCVLEMPGLERLHQALQAKGFTVLSVNMDDGGDEKVKKFVESYGLNFGILRDPKYAAADKFGVTGFPESFIIDRSGKFVDFKDPYSKTPKVRIISDRPWDSVNYIKELEKLL
jgi:peroxiredoxin